MISAFINVFRTYPELTLYLTLAIGFWAGSLHFGTFNLGVVTTTLLAGLAIGQIGISIPAIVQNTFFLAFLFAVGYAVGPQFIRAFKSDGLPQVIFAALVCMVGLGTAYAMGKLLHYDTALTEGLLSGGYTNSTVLGVATSSMSSIGLTQDALKTALALMPVAYAVTYPFGTVGSAWILSKLAPKWLKIDLVASAREYEQAHVQAAGNAPTAYRDFSARAYQVVEPELFGKSAREIETLFDHQVFVRRVREDGAIVDCDADTVIQRNAVVAIAGCLDTLVKRQGQIGPEIDDKLLLAFPTELLDVIVTKKNLFGKPLALLRTDAFDIPGRGVFLKTLSRDDQVIALDPNTMVHHGDVMTIEGAKQDVARVAKLVGFSDRPVETTDVSFMALGIVIGGLIGVITIHVGGIPLSLGTSVGAIVAGILCGYLHGKKRTFGQIPGSALWVFNNIGLNGFIAVVGLNAAPGFVQGLHSYGITLFVAGMVVTTVPLIAGLLLGKYVFKFHPVILLGACAGARSTTAALGALQEAAKSNVPAVGYTIGYAVSRIVMAVFAIVLLRVY